MKQAAELLVNAKRPVMYAGQGVHYAKAWPQLKKLAERLAIPVTTSLGGKSAFPETHPLSLGSGGLAVPRAVPKFLADADVIFGIGCSFTETNFGIAMPKGKTFIHSTVDPRAHQQGRRGEDRRWSATRRWCWRRCWRRSARP